MPTPSNPKELLRIKRLANIYKAMLEINQSIMRLSDESDLFPMICRTAVELGGVRMAWVGKLNDASGLIEPVACYGSGSEYLNNIVISANEDSPEGCGPTGIAFRENRIVVINNYQMSEITKPWHERAARYGWKSAGTFPIQRANRPFAVLSVYHSYLKAFDDETTNLLKEITGNISFALDNIDREAQRIKALEALRKSNEEIEDLYNHAPCGYHSLGKDGTILKVNDTELAWLGYAREEVVGKMKWPDLLTPASIQVFCENFPRYKESGFLRDLEMDVIRKDGTTFTALINATAIYDLCGNYLMSRTTINDITERKQIEDALRKSEERYRQIVETTNEGIWSMDAACKTTFVNFALCRMLGYRPDEMLGHTVEEFMFDADLEEHERQMQARQAGNNSVYERRFRRKDGSTCWCTVTATSLKDEQDAFAGSFAMFTDITEKKRSEDVIWRQANFDGLTGLPNRTLFYDRLEQEIKKAHRAALRMALLFIDLDRFKEVNDRFGHNIGDILLVEVARRIGGCVREADTVARLGGDEFTVILSELETAGGIERVAENILNKLAEPFRLGNEVVYISASIGITLYPDDATDVEELVKDADQAMYTAKNAGRNRFGYFTRSMQQAAQTRLQLASDLRDALAARQFRVYFQPIVDLATGRVDKAEALIRWQHPVRGMVSPTEFIPLAEENGLIVEIGDWVFKEAARHAKHWRATYNPLLQVSVNKSPAQFRQSGNGRERWLDYMQELDLPGQSITIEITEGLLLGAETIVMDKLLEFRDAGMRVSIDDFGTGYSSLSYLKKFDIDYLKIDQSFVRNLGTDPDDMALSEAIIMMAHKLGMKVVAEGVETEAQCKLLAAAGCDYAQGHLFSRPLPAEEFEVLLGHRDIDDYSI